MHSTIGYDTSLFETASEVLGQHSHLDLTKEIELVDDVIRGHGGYSDVYYGRFVMGGKYVAIKRLRVHIQKERQLVKAGRPFRPTPVFSKAIL
jgi:hypothetical protein